MVHLTDPGTLSKVLKRHGVQARKGLGQHFLVSERVVRAIVARVEGCAGVLEIGPGPGVLTQRLSEVSETVAVELDSLMLEVLVETAPSATIVQGDALQIDIGELLQRLREPRAVVSNLPYYITGPLLGRIADQSALFDRAVLMMQREVAQKIVAQPKDSGRGAVSVLFQSEFDISVVCQAPRGAFLPPPSVDSTVLEFRPARSKPSREFERCVRAGFTQPRKTLANNLVDGGYARPMIEAALADLGLDHRTRPHFLEIAAWERLSQLERA